MSLNSFFSRFVPKNDKFFPLFDMSVDSIYESSLFLKDLFLEYNNKERREEVISLIKEQELKGDDVTAKINKFLNISFITPFDREDISNLNDELDDINDAIFRCSHKISIYNPKELPSYTYRFVDIICEGAIEVKGAVNELSSFKNNDLKFKEHYRKIKQLEEEADVIYERGIMDLFASEKDTLEIIKLKDIIQGLEKTSNAIGTVGKILKIFVVKYA